MQPSQPTPPPHHGDYEFIMNPAVTPKKPLLSLPRSTGRLPRLALVVGGIVLLLVLFLVAKSLLGGGGSNTTALVSVAQEQQLLKHLASEGVKQQGANTTTQISSATIAATIPSAQQQLLAYLKNNKVTIKPVQLNARLNASLDTQLSTAASSGDYDATYKTVIQATLSNYQRFLKLAYTQTKGQKGHALLTADYDGATLLVQQLGN